jgi:amidohydrolase family protein
VELDKAIGMVTANAAKIFDYDAQIGTLCPGRDADISIFELRDGNFEFEDSDGGKRRGPPDARQQGGCAAWAIIRKCALEVGYRLSWALLPIVHKPCTRRLRLARRAVKIRVLRAGGFPSRAERSVALWNPRFEFSCW